jgi:uncharacterized phage infection (PIP) family protein YhgE
MNGDKREILKLIVVVIAAVGIGGALYDIPPDVTDQIIQWLISIFISLVFSILAGSLVEAFSGDLLKTLFINLPLTDNISIPVSFFFIVTLLAKYLLFGGIA